MIRYAAHVRKGEIVMTYSIRMGSLLEYCFPFMATHLNKDIVKLQYVQKKGITW
jgi:hypothetical protein